MDSQELARSLGRLEEGVSGINARLDKLNGSVARHEKHLGELETRVAVAEAKEQSAKETSKTWREAVLPFVKALLVLLAGAALGSKGPEIVKAFSR